MVKQQTLTFQTEGRGAVRIDNAVAAAVADSGIDTGLCHVFIRHTSASLMMCENADPDVLTDLEAFFARTVPDGDPLYKHVAEGPDDMPAHVRSVLTQSDITLPVTGQRPDLGTWQGIYLYEHRHAPHRRSVVVTVYGH